VIRLWRQWRMGVYIARATEASAEAGKICLDAIREGGALRCAGKPEPSWPESWPAPFDAKAPRRRRRENLRRIKAHAWAWGLAAGWHLVGTEADLATTAEQMVRDAEIYANRGTS
jgi:hypothetical protein